MTRRAVLVTIPLAVLCAAAGSALGDRSALVLGVAAVLGVASGLLLDAAYRRGFAAERDDRPGADVAEVTRVERLLDGLPLAVLLLHDQRVVYANPAARTLFPDAAAGAAARTGLRHDVLADAVEESGETGRGVEVDVRVGGREFSARASVTAAGEVALVVLDVTESRRLDEVRRDFVTNASHELKTPVAGIQALAESLDLAFTRHPDRARQMLARLQGEAVRLAQLVRDLLDLARLEEAGAQQSRRVDVVDVVRSQVDRLAPLAEQREVHIEIAATHEASIVAVPTDVRLIVANLLENAVLYNHPGGSVRVSVRRVRAEVRLAVADTGIGISEVDRDRVFERFYRVDKGRSRAAGGTGLGLSLVRHAVERTGGRVMVDSRLDHGSTFSVILPVEGSTAEARTQETSSTR